MQTSKNIATIKGFLEKAAGIAIENIEKNSKGFSNESYRGILDRKEVFFRVSDSQKGLESEYLATRLAAAAGVPVPQLIQRIKNKQEQLDVLVFEKAKGKILSACTFDKKTEEKVFWRLGKLLRKINSIPLKNFGALVSKNGTEGSLFSWREYILQKKSPYKVLFEVNIISKKELTLILGAVGQLSQINLDPVLLHTGFHKEHIFIDNNKASGVIDFSRAASGDARYDIAYSLHFLSSEQAESFKKGYGKEAQDPVVNLYRLLVAANKAHWFFKNGFAGKTKAIARLKKVFESVS